jgi:hypothetical protein
MRLRRRAAKFRIDRKLTFKERQVQQGGVAASWPVARRIHRQHALAGKQPG